MLLLFLPFIRANMNNNGAGLAAFFVFLIYFYKQYEKVTS